MRAARVLRNHGLSADFIHFFQSTLKPRFSFKPFYRMVSLYISSNLGHFINVPVRFEYLRSCSLIFNDGTRPQSTCEYAPLQPLGGNVLLLSFAYVCPEPVLANIRLVV